MLTPAKLLGIAVLAFVGVSCGREAEPDRARTGNEVAGATDTAGAHDVRDTSAIAAAADPHAGHDTSAPTIAAAAEHEGHSTAGGAEARGRNAHTGHAQRAPAAAGDHEGHTAARTAPRHEGHTTARAAGQHEGHTPTGGGVQSRTDSAEAHAKLMLLARSLVVDSAVQRRIQAIPELRALWADEAVRKHITEGKHRHQERQE